MSLKSMILWHHLQQAKSQTAILFGLVLSDDCFVSICITSVFWESKIGSIKTGVAVGFISSTLSSSAIVTSSYRVLLAYFGGVMRHTYMRFISLISHASSFENECWTGSLSRSRTEEFKQYLYFRWKRIMSYGGYFHKQCSWVYAGSVYPSRIRC